jgi:hypothetical protein
MKPSQSGLSYPIFNGVCICPSKKFQIFDLHTPLDFEDVEEEEEAEEQTTEEEAEEEEEEYDEDSDEEDEEEEREEEGNRA